MWSHIELFILLARTGSFQRAAQEHSLSPVTLSRRMDLLEENLGSVLFLRGKTGLILTGEGAELLKLVEPLNERVSQTLKQAERLGQHLKRRRLRVSATEPVITEILAPHIGALHFDDRTQIELRVENEAANLAMNEAEIALRFLKPEGDSLRVRRLATFKMSLWRHKDDSSAPDLQNFVGYDNSYGDIPERVWMKQADLLDRANVLTSSTIGVLNIIKSASAAGILPDIIASKHDELERVSGWPEVPDRPIWLMMHPDISRQDNVRKTVDWLSNVFRNVG